MPKCFNEHTNVDAKAKFFMKSQSFEKTLKLIHSKRDANKATLIYCFFTFYVGKIQNFNNIFYSRKEIDYSRKEIDTLIYYCWDSKMVKCQQKGIWQFCGV